MSATLPQALDLEQNRDLYKDVTDRILAALAKGKVPWRKPWSKIGVPRNAVSQNPYSGINIFLLTMDGYGDARWLTAKQAGDLGGKVKAGERPTLIVFWRALLVEDEDAQEGESEDRTVPLLRHYLVYNVEQCEGLALKPRTDDNLPFKPIERAEEIVAGMPRAPKIDHAGGDQAFYSPSQDRIALPSRGAFHSPSEYYATLFHEMGHSTGHKSRLDRHPWATRFGDEHYAREELTAEFCSAFLCAEARIDSTLDNSSAYIQSWISRLRDDRRLAIAAAGKGQRAAMYILDEEYTQEAEMGQEIELRNQANMAQIGPRYWARLHQWADELKAEVGGSCPCGDLAVSAARALHDAVNVGLGKPVQHPDGLRATASFLQGAVATLPAMLGQETSAGRRNLARFSGHLWVPATFSNPNHRELKQEYQKVLVDTGAAWGNLPLEVVRRLQLPQMTERPGRYSTVAGKVESHLYAANIEVKGHNTPFYVTALGDTPILGVYILEFMQWGVNPVDGELTDLGPPLAMTHVSQGFLDFLIGGAAQAAGATIGAALVARTLGGATAVTSPEAAVKVIDDRDRVRVVDERKGEAGVYAPRHVEGDQADVEIGTLLQELDAILRDPAKQGLVDPDKAKVVKEGA